jgi:hypothetical protein
MCSESGEYVDVQLTTLPYDVNIGSIELEVTAIITWNRKVLGGNWKKWEKQFSQSH